MTDILVIAGASGTGKSDVAARIAKRENALLLPIDQLHLYRDLEKGTGLDASLREGIRTHGYQMLSPWTRFTPNEYVQWLKDTFMRFPRERLIVIEGGCTSYLSELLRSRESDALLKTANILGLTFSSEENRIQRNESRVSMGVFREVVAEVIRLRQKGYYDDSGIELFGQCESFFVHPEHEHSGLAWAVRISAGVYYPAFLVSVSQLSESEGRFRLLRNLSRIQAYQDDRIRLLLGEGRVFVPQELIRYLEATPLPRRPESRSR